MTLLAHHHQSPPVCPEPSTVTQICIAFYLPSKPALIVIAITPSAFSAKYSLHHRHSFQAHHTATASRSWYRRARKFHLSRTCHAVGASLHMFKTRSSSSRSRTVGRVKLWGDNTSRKDSLSVGGRCRRCSDRMRELFGLAPSTCRRFVGIPIIFDAAAKDLELGKVARRLLRLGWVQSN